MEISVGIFVLIILISVAVSLAVGLFIGIAHRKRVAEAAIGSAEQEATRIVNEAVTKAESAKKEKILEAKDRKKAGATAPANGLFLYKINFDGVRVHQ